MHRALLDLVDRGQRPVTMNCYFAMEAKNALEEISCTGGMQAFYFVSGLYLTPFWRWKSVNAAFNAILVHVLAAKGSCKLP